MSEYAAELIELVQNLAEDADTPADGTVTRLWGTVQELGLTGIGIAEDAGGSGGELADLMVVIRELGRAGIATPIVEAATAAFAVGIEDTDGFDTVVVTSGPNGDLPVLTADLGRVAFAQEAQRIVILGDDGIAVVAVADADVMPVADIAGLPMARVRVHDAPCVRPDVDVAAVDERLTLARSAALIGNCWGAYALTKQYVAQRHQFGAALLAIPAVSTSVAQMAVTVRAAESALNRAIAVCGRADSTELQRLGAVSSARISAAQAATTVARSAHQLHGAVGVTREYQLHRFTRALWAQRDADRSERAWRNRLGATTLAVGEDLVWDELTA